MTFSQFKNWSQKFSARSVTTVVTLVSNNKPATAAECAGDHEGAAAVAETATVTTQQTLVGNVIVPFLFS